MEFTSKIKKLKKIKMHLELQEIRENIVKLVLRCHLWDKEKVAL